MNCPHRGMPYGDILQPDATAILQQNDPRARRGWRAVTHGINATGKPAISAAVNLAASADSNILRIHSIQKGPI